MKSALFFILFLSLSLIANTQNLVQINNFTDNYPENTSFLNILSTHHDKMLVSKSNKKYTAEQLTTKLKTVLSENCKQVYYLDDKAEKLIELTSKYSQGLSSVYINKYSLSGDLEFSRVIEIPNTTDNFRIKADSKYIYLLGSYSEQFRIGDFESKPPAKSGFFILKLDLTGNIINLLSETYQSDIIVKDFEISDKYYYLTGAFTDSLYNNISHGRTDIFLLKVGKRDLSVSQILTIGGEYEDIGISLGFDNEQHLILFANSSSDITVKDVSYKNVGCYDIVVCKLDDNMQILSSNHFGTTGNDYITDYVFNQFNDLYLTGTYRTQLLTDDKQKKDLFFNQFIAKIGSNNNLRFIQGIEDTVSSVYNPQISINKRYTLFATGNKYKKNINKGSYFYEFFDCDYGKKIDLPDYYYVSENNKSYIATEGFSEYLWSNGCKKQEIFFENSGLYYLTAKDTNGCISIDSITVIFPIINNKEENNKLSNLVANVSPNPASDFIDINLFNIDTKDNIQIFIISQTGTIVYYKQINKPLQTLNNKVNIDFNSGIYNIKILNGNNQYIKKISIIK